MAPGTPRRESPLSWLRNEQVAPQERLPQAHRAGPGTPRGRSRRRRLHRGGHDRGVRHLDVDDRRQRARFLETRAARLHRHRAGLVNLYTWRVYFGARLAPWKQSLARLTLRWAGYGTKKGRPLEAAHGSRPAKIMLILTMVTSVVVIVALAWLLYKR